MSPQDMPYSHFYGLKFIECYFTMGTLHSGIAYIEGHNAIKYTDCNLGRLKECYGVFSDYRGLCTEFVTHPEEGASRDTMPFNTVWE